MPEPLAIALCVGSGLAALAWLGVLVDPRRAWQLRPVAEDEPPSPPPAAWPSVGVIIPAHNEAEALTETLVTTLGQSYDGDWRVVVVDERSSDATSDVAQRHADSSSARGRLAVATGRPLPDGWTGKVWGLEQGRSTFDGREPDFYLLTDADIAHEPTSLRTLVTQSEHAQLALNSRMARLHCTSAAEQALIPAFVFFFNLLYPMRCVNDSSQTVAAAAGGCMLLRSDALRSIGGFERIRGEVIDDVNLAREVKKADLRIRLAVSRRDVRSVRRYESIGPIWRMVRRTAFDELGYSWLKLVGTVLGMLVLFPLPAIGLALGASLAAADAAGAVSTPGWQFLCMGGCSVAALLMMRIAYGPAAHLFELRQRWAWTLPFGGAVYGAITVDSARQHLRGRSGQW